MIRNLNIKYLISSNINYYKKTLDKILPNLINQIPSKNIIITISDCNNNIKVPEIRTFCVNYNSYEYTSLINLSYIEYQECDFVFLLHDTMVCGDNFSKLSRMFDTSSDMTMAHRSGWCNLGVYNMNYLISQKNKLMSMKKITKIRAIEMEGSFLGNDYSTYENAGCELLNEQYVYESVKRNLCYFRCVDIYKYGSNNTESFIKNQVIDAL